MPNSVSVHRLELVEVVLYVLANKDLELEDFELQLVKDYKRVLLGKILDQNQVIL